MTVLLDTNILLRADASGHFGSEAVAQRIERLAADGAQICIAAQCLIEAWSVMTRPKSANGLGMEPGEARAELDRMTSSFSLLPDPPNLYTTWLDLCTAHEVRGRQVYDARLVALMVASGIKRFVTLNPQDFARYSMLDVIVPGR